MNKQEAIEKIERRKKYFSTDDDYDRGYRDGLEGSRLILEQLDEPKAVIPQFVAEWIEDNRGALEEYVYSNVQIALSRIQEDNPMHDRLNGKGIGVIVDCVRNGYEAKEEPLYTAKLKIITSTEADCYVNKNKIGFFLDSNEYKPSCRVRFTQSELEELKIWDNPAFEIEEVKNDNTKI